MIINDEFIDNFDSIYESELKAMKSKLIQNDIKFVNDRELIHLFKDIQNMTKSEIEEWKESDYVPSYYYIDYDDTNQYFLSGMLLLDYNIDPNKLKNLFNKISYYGRVFLAYKLSIL